MISAFVDKKLCLVLFSLGSAFSDLASRKMSMESSRSSILILLRNTYSSTIGLKDVPNPAKMKIGRHSSGNGIPILSSLWKLSFLEFINSAIFWASTSSQVDAINFFIVLTLLMLWFRSIDLQRIFQIWSGLWTFVIFFNAGEFEQRSFRVPRHFSSPSRNV